MTEQIKTTPTIEQLVDLLRRAEAAGERSEQMLSQLRASRPAQYAATEALREALLWVHLDDVRLEVIEQPGALLFIAHEDGFNARVRSSNDGDRWRWSVFGCQHRKVGWSETGGAATFAEAVEEITGHIKVNGLC